MHARNLVNIAVGRVSRHYSHVGVIVFSASRTPIVG